MEVNNMKLTGKVRDKNGDLFDFEFEGTSSNLDALANGGTDKLKAAVLKLID